MTGGPDGPGFLLVASPELLDPNFARTVVLTITHDDEGSYGLVLNRPLGRTLRDVMPAPGDVGGEIPLFQGGPVQVNVLQLLSPDPAAGRELLPGVTLGKDLESVLGIADGRGARGFVGYAGWGARQLESETAEGSWVIAPARSEHVFEIPTADLWPTVLKELGGQYRWLSMEGGDPDVN